MTVVNSKEFITNEDKYFDLAMNEQVFVQRGDNMFLVSIANVVAPNDYDEILDPDEDFHSAISGDEFKKRAIEIVEKVHNMF